MCPHDDQELTETEDNAVHLSDPDTGNASPFQIGVVGIALIAILTIFFYGVNSQRTEVTAPANIAGTQQQQQHR
jgi:hypothetical protein